MGALLVFVAMAVYYRRAGWNAVLALILNALLLAAAMALFEATLTLPGIAGFILTIGMAVDSNVLVFERIREELRNGRAPEGRDRERLLARPSRRSSTRTRRSSSRRSSCSSSEPDRSRASPSR